MACLFNVFTNGRRWCLDRLTFFTYSQMFPTSNQQVARCFTYVAGTILFYYFILLFYGTILLEFSHGHNSDTSSNSTLSNASYKNPNDA